MQPVPERILTAYETSLFEQDIQGIRSALQREKVLFGN